jgi:ATP-dependent DNA ligase
MLPTVLPMLATSGEPFDSPEYRFEIKWDGIRVLAAIDATGWHLWGRDVADYTLRYPELAVLRDLPPGTLVDGELVVRGPTRPTLAVLLQRHHLSDPWQIRLASRWCPSTSCTTAVAAFWPNRYASVVNAWPKCAPDSRIPRSLLRRGL